MIDTASRLIALGFNPHVDFDAYYDGPDEPVRVVWHNTQSPQPAQAELEAVAIADPVPAEVSRAQALLALDAAHLYDAVKTAVDAHPVRAVQIWYYNAAVWHRGNAYVQALGQELNLTDEQIDTLFRAAAVY